MAPRRLVTMLSGALQGSLRGHTACPALSATSTSGSELTDHARFFRACSRSAAPCGRCSDHVERGCAATDEPRPGPPLNQLWKRRRHDITGHGCGVFVYTGPLSQAVKNLKRLSIGGCVASVFGSPILVLGAAEAMPPAAQASIIATISGFGLFTTGLLHWFTSPYVHRLEHERGTGNLTVETVSILGRPQQTRFHESKVRYPNTIRPQVTFEVDGKFFYLDADHFGDRELLSRLTPAEPTAIAEGASKADRD